MRLSILWMVEAPRVLAGTRGTTDPQNQQLIGGW
jgi:hypothetical protein